MRKPKWMGIFVLALLLGACQSATESPASVATQVLPAAPPAGAVQAAGGVPDSAAEVPRIALAELKSLMDEGARVVIVDTRDLASYDRGHIPGAGQMSAEELETRYRELPKGPPIVLYCA